MARVLQKKRKKKGASVRSVHPHSFLMGFEENAGVASASPSLAAE